MSVWPDLIKIGGTLAAVWFGAWLTERSAGRKFLVERYWDARREAYSALIQHLRSAAKHASSINHNFNETGKWHEEEYISSEYYKESAHEFNEEWKISLVSFESNYLIFGSEIASEFSILRSELDGLNFLESVGHKAVSEHAFEAHQLFIRHIDKIAELARDELKPPQPAAHWRAKLTGFLTRQGWWSPRP